MNKIFVLFLCVFLASCDGPPPTPKKTLEEQAANNRELQKPIKIAEIDGVRVWKVRDKTEGGAQYVYFTSRGETYEEHSCGKNCTEHQFVPGTPDEENKQ